MSADLRTVQHPPQLQALKRQTKALVKAAGGQEEAEGVTGKSQPRLSAYGLPNTPDFAPIDTVLALEAVTHGTLGHPLVTRFLASEAGYLLVAKPAALPADVDWCAALARAGAEFQDVQQRVLNALPDGVTAAEIVGTDLRREIGEAMQCLAQLDALAARALEES
jgi:hypothetical protein